MLDLLGAERGAVRRPGRRRSRPRMPLLAPIEPPTIRDFSRLRAAHRGCDQDRLEPDAPVPDGLVRAALLLLLEPVRDHRAGRGHPRRRRAARLMDLELEVAAIIGREGRNLRPEPPARTSPATRSSTTGPRATSAGKEVQTPFGQCKGKDFANTLGPGSSPPTSSSRSVTATGSTSRCRPSSTASSSAATRWRTWPGASRRWSRTPRAGRGSGRATCSAPAPAGPAACSSSGAGAAAPEDPPPLKAGDVVTLRVEGIGELTNRLVEGLRADRAAARPATKTRA